MDVWRQWYGAAANLWPPIPENARNPFDPFGLYAERLEKMAHDMPGWTKAGPVASTDPAGLYRHWLESARDLRDRAAEAGSDRTGLTAQWVETIEALGARVTTGDVSPADLLTMFAEWYNATSEVSSTIAADVVGSEAFVKSVSELIDLYATSHHTFSRTMDQYFRALQLPTRSDISRVAALVVALESKVDRIEEALENLDSRLAADAVTSLAERLSQVERKLDTVLGSIEQGEGTTVERARGRP